MTLFAGSATSGFSPSSIPNLAVWFDANDLASLTYDGSKNISQVSDKSGNGRHATQGTLLNQPKLVLNTYNGRPAIRGDGTNTWMSFSGPDLSSANGYTIVAVGGIGSSTASGIYGQYPSSGTGNGIAIWSGLYRTGRSGSAITFPTGNSTIQGVPFGFIYRNDGTKTTANTKVLATWNATERVSTTTQNAGTPAAGTAYLTAVNPADSPLQDKLCEFLIFSRQITDDERDALYTYLTAKWLPVYEAPPVASPALWLDAADARTIDLDSSNNVITWLDKSGNGRHVTQSTVLNRPTVSTATLTGLTAIKFEQKSLSHALTYSLGSLFIVWEHPTTYSGAYNGIGGYRNGGGSDLEMSLLLPQVAGGPPPTQVWQLYNAAETSTIVRLNGVQRAAAENEAVNASPARVSPNRWNLVSATFPVKTGTKTLYLGTEAYAPTTRLMQNGHIAEVIGYSSTLSPGDVATMESYLSTKWGIS